MSSSWSSIIVNVVIFLSKHLYCFISINQVQVVLLLMLLLYAKYTLVHESLLKGFSINRTFDVVLFHQVLCKSEPFLFSIDSQSLFKMMLNERWMLASHKKFIINHIQCNLWLCNFSSFLGNVMTLEVNTHTHSLAASIIVSNEHKKGTKSKLKSH
jgi:hypothetical protein